MNNSHVSGKLKEVKGKIKEELGHATGNSTLAGEGVIDQIKGKVQEKLGNAKDSVKRSVDRFLNNDKKA